MKRIISLVLCLSLVLTGAAFVVPVQSATPDGANIPVIHVIGTGEDVFRIDENGNEEQVFEMQFTDEYIAEKAEVFLPVFAEAFFTQEWDEFCDVLYDCAVPILSKPALDKNGEVSDGSYIKWNWSRETLQDKKQNGKYGVTAYEFLYDWRVSPLDTADTLKQYIEDIMYVTGAEEVALYGRCYGSNVVNAYMKKYDGEHVSEVIHYCSAFYGATLCSKVFTGELYLHSDGIGRYVYDINLGLESYIEDFIKASVTLLNKTYGLDIISWAVDNVLEDIYLDIFPRILIESYGTFPSYWSMVSIEDFDKAMETVFYGVDKSEYAGLIDKIYEYRNTVQLPFADTLKEQTARGIEYSNIVKYGVQSIPLTKDSDILSDDTVSVKDSSFGATVTAVDEKFSDDYIEAAVADQRAKYISPDLQIDASTCMLPDTTWFIKDLYHTEFPGCVNGLVSDIVNNDNFTVDSNPDYPQYLVYERTTGSLVPMTSDNLNTTERWEVTFVEAMKSFFKTLFAIIKKAVQAA